MRLHYVKYYPGVEGYSVVSSEEDYLRKINEYIGKTKFSINWSRADIIRIITYPDQIEWRKNDDLFFWDGNELIKPFNDNRDPIYSAVDEEGHVPIHFNAFEDFIPYQPFDNNDGVKNNSIVYFNFGRAFPDEIIDTERAQLKLNNDTVYDFVFIEFMFNYEKYFVVSFAKKDVFEKQLNTDYTYEVQGFEQGHRFLDALAVYSDEKIKKDFCKVFKWRYRDQNLLVDFKSLENIQV